MLTGIKSPVGEQSPSSGQGTAEKQNSSGIRSSAVLAAENLLHPKTEIILSVSFHLRLCDVLCRTRFSLVQAFAAILMAVS